MNTQTLENVANIAKKVAADSDGRVMVKNAMGKRRHLKLYDDGPNHCYVTTGKRGQRRERLTSYRIVCTDPLLVEFESLPEKTYPGQTAFETAMGMRGYSGSPAQKEDRENGIKVGGICNWLAEDPSKPGVMPVARITAIEIIDGDPWFDLTLIGDDSDHKPLCVEREEITPYKGYLQWQQSKFTNAGKK